jgi:hypothetical protein
MARARSYEGEILGACLQSTVLALGGSQVVLQQMMKVHGLTAIDPDKWYNLNMALSMFQTVGQQVGEATLQTIGIKMLDTAAWPPEVTDVRSMLLSMDAAYKLNFRGPKIGDCVVTFDDDHSATMVLTSVTPCPLARGVVQAGIKRFAPNALLEHSEGCMERGADNCTYFITW